MIHDYKLRPYHNPESVDESKVPKGWRMLYANEAGQAQLSACRMWIPSWGRFGVDKAIGQDRRITYIVPVTP